MRRHLTPPRPPAQEQGDNDEFVDCEDDVEEDSAGNRQETGTTVARVPMVSLWMAGLILRLAQWHGRWSELFMKW